MIHVECHTHRCFVENCAIVCRRRVQRHRDWLEMERYRALPLPYCTWGLESGPPSEQNPEWSGPRYSAYNSSSGASGKYQILATTWAYFGGPGSPLTARPVVQERIARRVMIGQGPRAWVGC